MEERQEAPMKIYKIHKQSDEDFKISVQIVKNSKIGNQSQSEKMSNNCQSAVNPAA
jgi:hypothetical protein